VQLGTVGVAVAVAALAALAVARLQVQDLVQDRNLLREALALALALALQSLYDVSQIVWILGLLLNRETYWLAMVRAQYRHHCSRPPTVARSMHPPLAWPREFPELPTIRSDHRSVHLRRIGSTANPGAWGESQMEPQLLLLPLLLSLHCQYLLRSNISLN
jgi:hypothetical protein